MAKKLKGHRTLPIGPSQKPESIAAREQGILVTVDRWDILARQLNTAISLWFDEKDPVSIRILASGAHRNLHELTHKKQPEKGPTLKGFIDWDTLYLAYDAFRHGGSSVEFVPDATESMMLDAIVSFHRLYGFRTPLMTTFGTYLTLPRLAADPANKFFYEGVRMKQIRHLSRKKFVFKMLPIYTRSTTANR
jgi:hypothetical protein